ncbi:hypothetical protein MHZ92_12115 [Sporosarcina sp. ACRSL]|uniref:hypothetical protein n=1 Tax=Sporosarcina sp. ACRSL TaxID=2918215 RepID=UPI001EF5CDF9|nr:hypothetical protein [Sporosarcina sp. ACRSL]MCG7344883.1 hypothetical protein [Sporosarcina sp. ACRSL]
MELTVKELLHDAFLYDLPLMAHTVYYALQQGLVHLDDPESRIPYKELDYDEITKMKDDNWLRMCTVKLFVVPLGGKRFAFYLAETPEEVRVEHRTIYGGVARRVNDVSHKMVMSIYCEVTKRSQSFWEIKREVLQFPYYVGEVGG